MTDTLDNDLTTGQRLLVLTTAFIGWMMAGTNMAIVPLAGRSVTLSLGGDYDRMTCLVYLLGMVIICFAPDTSKKRLDGPE